MKIKKRYILNERQEPVEVAIDLATFRKIEDLLEDILFGRILEKAKEEKPLSLEEVKRRYNKLKNRTTKKRA